MSSDSSVIKNKKHDPFAIGSIELVVPSTSSQREMWSSIKMDENSSLCYNESLQIDLEGKLNQHYFEKAFEEIIKRHNGLRLVFSRDGKNVFIKEFNEFNVHFIDLSNDNNVLTSIDKIRFNEINSLFDLENGPLVRGTLIKINNESYKFIFTAHHIVCDGWSIAIIVNELSELYNSFLENRSSNLTFPYQFSDYAILEMNSGENINDKNYWLNEFFHPIPVRNFPTNFPRKRFRTFESKRLDFEVSEQLVLKLKKLSSKNGSSFYTALVSAFNLLQTKILKQNDIVLGLSSATQPAINQNDLVGHFVNLIPLRSFVDPKKTFSEFLKYNRTNMLDAFDHQFYSYGQLVKDLKNIDRQSFEMPILNIVFNIDQQQPNQGLNLDNIKASYHSIPRVAENFELFINAVSRENILILECQFNSNLFTEQTIKNWFESYIELLELLVEFSDIALENIILNNLMIPTTGKIVEVISNAIATERDLEKESVVKSLWQEVLGLSEIEVDDNFFAVGGHSLLAIDLGNLIEDKFKIKFSMKDIFEFPTIELMSYQIKERSKSGEVLVWPEIIASDESSFNVSYSQMQICFLEEMFPKTTMHNLPAAIRVKSLIDRFTLEKALNIILNRHPVLRTVIVYENGIPIQKVKDFDEASISVEEVNINEDQLLDRLNEETQYSFDLEKAPLFKCILYKLNKDDYVIYFLIHHAVWDGWSFDIFFNELNLIYSDLVNHKTLDNLPRVAVSFIDHTIWLKNLIDKGTLNTQLDYWKKKLASPLPLLDLPTDFKRPANLDHEGGTFPFILSEVLSKKLRNFSKKYESSLFNIFLTAYKITLSRFSNPLEIEDDIIVGAPVRGRVRPEVLNTIGYFVNSVALRTKINHNLSFIDNLNSVSRTCLEAFENQLLPFQIVLNKVSNQKDKSRTPVFQTFFSYQDVSNRKAELNGSRYSQINIDKASTHTDLDLWIKASDSKIEGAFEFRLDLFERKSIEQFYDSFIGLLNTLDEVGEISLKNLPVLTTANLDYLINTINDTSDNNFKDLNLVDLFIEEVKLHPELLAISDDEKSLTYEELNKLSNQCANLLISKGIKGGDVVGISLKRNSQLLVGVLGILKAGAAYLPLDPSFPADRLNYMVDHSKAKVILVDNSYANSFSNEVLLIELKDSILLDQSKELNKTISQTLSSVAYIIYTSGSTGLPKGVVLSHGSVTNFLQSMKKKEIVKANDKLLAVTTLSFDISVLELFLPLICGASIVIAKSSDVIDGSKLLSLINRNYISVMQATPTTWRLLLASGFTGGNHFTILCGGEPFPIDLAHKLTKIVSNVWNMYGPTETTVWSTCKKLSSSDQVITVGRPIDNTTIYILDDFLRLVPYGSIGQIYIGGRGLALGYYGREDLTLERFIPNPHKKDELIYATGDLGRYVHNGEIECLGRNDGQVKIRGYRIELGEIESKIQKIQNVDEVAVVTSEVKAGDIRIVAYISTLNKEKISEKEYRTILSKSLSNYMIPSHFVWLYSIPKTLNGKIDKKSLPPFLLNQNSENTTQRTDSGNSKLNPSANQNVEQMREIWKKSIGVENVLNSDNFFDIGGNSLIAIEMYSLISNKFNKSLRLSSLIDAESFESFCNFVFEINSEENRSPSINLIPSVNTLFKSLVSISKSGELSPLYCFHGAGGNILNYVSLIPAVNNKRPLLAFQSIGLDGESIPYSSIEDMANAYYLELKIAQPKGPYLLAGGSMGGLIAMEVARKLLAEGETVKKLIMFDTFGPNLNLKSYSSKKNISFFNKVLTAIHLKSKKLLNNIVVRVYRKFGFKIPLSVLLFDIEQQNYKAIWKYHPERYSGDIDLIRSKLEKSGWYSDPLMGWDGIIQGKIKTYHINGTHEKFIESQELVKVLGKVLDE